MENASVFVNTLPVFWKHFLARDNGITIATLGALKRHGYLLRAHCRDRQRADVVDLDRAIKARGAGDSYIGRSLGLNCTASESRNVAMTINARG